jgi:hypothetical protein
MKNLKSIILCLFFSTFCFSLWAKKVEIEDAKKVALRHVESTNFSLRSQNRIQNRIQLKHTVFKNQKQEQLRSQNVPDTDTICYYVFDVDNGKNEGFVIVSGDDAAMPVLGYSDNGHYDVGNLAPAFVYWMECLQQEIEYAVENNLEQPEKVGMAWDSYLDNDGGKGNNWRTNNVIVEPLVQTKWNQTKPYNNMCPTISGANTVTGCVATTMAQVMKYHNHPARGMDSSPAYQTKSPSSLQIPSVNFDVDYDWDNMLRSYSSGNNGNETSEQKDAVATLMYHCGVSSQMDYQLSSSSASTRTAAQSLVNYFNYDARIQYKERDYYDNTAWENMLKEQLDKRLPVMYSGYNDVPTGHAFICDGYAQNGYFHFNWGWGGYLDGYYLTTALEPGTGGTGSGAGTYNLRQHIIIDIMPDEGGVPAPAELKLYDGLSASTQSVDRNEPFSVNFRVENIGQTPSLARIVGVALINDNDEILEVIYSGNLISLKPNYSQIVSARCFVSENIEPGNYKLKVIIKQNDGNREFLTGKINDVDILDLEVKSNIRPEYELKLKTDISSSATSVDRGEPFTIDISVNNYGIRSFVGYVGTALVDSENQILEVIGMDSRSSNIGVYDGTFLSITSAVSAAIPVGIYTLRVVEKEPSDSHWKLIDGNPDVVDRINIEVKEEIVPDNSNLKLFGANNQTFALTPNSIKQGEALSVKVILFNNGRRAFFGEISLGLHDLDGNLVELIESRILSVSNNNTTYSYTFYTPQITSECGDYTMTLYQRSFSGEVKKVAPRSSTSYLNDMPVTVISDGGCMPTSTSDVKTEVAQVYPNPVRQGESIELVLSENTVESILYIYNATGLLRKSITLPAATIHTIDTTDLTQGIWLFQVIGENGERQVMKVVVE